MLSDSRFWGILILYFSAALLGNLIYGRLRKKKNSLWILYLIMALISSIGLWLSQPLWKEFVNTEILLLIVFTLGLFQGGIPPVIVVLFLSPFLISMNVNVPLKPMVSEKSQFLGELQFFPSNEGTLSLIWTSDGDEIAMSLDGEKAAVLFCKSEIPAAFFFLQEEIIPYAVLSRNISIQDLPVENQTWLHYLWDDEITIPWDMSYPALKYLEQGFFTRYEYHSQSGSVEMIRK